MTKVRRSLSERMLWGLAGGIVVGVFLGERAAVLQVGADAYIKLLQMTVLPYVTVSIVAGLGSLSAAQARALGWRVGAVLALLWGVALGAVFLFPLMFPSGENTGMRPLEDRGRARVFKRGEDVPPLAAVTTSVLDRVRQRGALRVGYLDDSLPYVFFNARGELTGLDVEMAMQLARDLGVTAEFVPVDRTIFTTGLDPASCDLVMSGVVITTERSLHVQFSSPYLDETVAFIVPDHLASAFSDWSTVKATGRLRLGVPEGAYFLRKIREELGNVEEIVPIARMEDMFVPHTPPIDAFVATAERGSAYTLLHPAYSVAVPKPRPFKLPLAYVIAGRDAGLTTTVNAWIDQKHDDDTIDELFAHWIMGQDSAPRSPRWSVVHDVLHWL